MHNKTSDVNLVFLSLSVNHSWPHTLYPSLPLSFVHFVLNVLALFIFGRYFKIFVPILYTFWLFGLTNIVEWLLKLSKSSKLEWNWNQIIYFPLFLCFSLSIFFANAGNSILSICDSNAELFIYLFSVTNGCFGLALFSMHRDFNRLEIFQFGCLPFVCCFVIDEPCLCSMRLFKS